MYLQLYLVIAATVCIQSIFPDEIVQISQETDTRRYVCGNTVVFKCQSNDTACCSTFGKTRFWKKDDVIIMNHGTEINPSNKYKETFDDNDDNFVLTVQHLTDEDFDKSYGCEYVSDPSFSTLEHKYTICWCYECGITVFGFVCIISVAVINIVTAFWGLYQEHKNKKDYIGIAAALFFSLFVTGLCNGLIAGTAGIYKCLCYDGKGPLMIIAGIGSGLVGTIPAVFIHKRYKIAKYVWLLGILAVVTNGTVIAELIWIGGYLEGRCPVCGGRSYMWSCIGSVIALAVIFCLLYCCTCISTSVKNIKRAAIFSVSIWMMSLVLGVVFAVPIGTYLCPCFDWTHPFFTALGFLFSMLLLGVFKIYSLYDKDECTLNLWMRFAGLVVLSLLVFPIPFLFYYYGSSDDANSSWKKCLRVIGLVVLAILIFPIPFLIIHFCLEEFIEYIRTKIGSNIQLKSPFKNYNEQITWTWTEEKSTSSLILSDGTNLRELPQDLAERLTLKDGDLFISNVQESDTGIYACELSPKAGAEAPQVSKLQLTVRGGGNNRSKESGSSCWPPCSVGPDPNSPDPENARSLLKKKADKKNEKKPVAVVRSQPPKIRHVKTDNTESTRYSAETEIFDEGVHKSAKPRPLPSIGQPTNSPRPLPQMPPSSQLEKGGIQLEPLGDSTAEKKKKKRKKKKESKQSDEEN